MTFAFRLPLLLLLMAVSSAAESLKVVAPWNTLVLTAEDLTKLPRTEVSVQDPHGEKQRKYSGVLVREILVRAGAPMGAKLRGAALQLVVIARCVDGYGVVFALADFEEMFGNRTVLLADEEDGLALPPNAAPFRLIVPGDKKGARWARMVTSLEILSVGTTPPSHQH